MKKRYSILLAVLLFILIVALSLNLIIKFLVEQTLKNVFKESSVTIGACRLYPAKGIVFSDIRIIKKPDHVIYVKEAGAEFTFSSLFKGRTPKVYLNSPDISIYLPQIGSLIIKDLIFNETGLQVALIKLNNLTISGIDGKFKIAGNQLNLSPVSAQSLGGIIDADIKIKFDQIAGYEAVLKFTALDIAKFIRDFDLKDKFEMTGRLSGNLTLKGQGSDIKTLNGELSTLKSGGMLIIKDTKYLENIARNTNQSLDLLVENFKNYHYNIGAIKLSLNNNNLMLDAALDGETGKRDIKIVLHDFSLKKEGQ